MAREDFENEHGDWLKVGTSDDQSIWLPKKRPRPPGVTFETFADHDYYGQGAILIPMDQIPKLIAFLKEMMNGP